MAIVYSYPLISEISTNDTLVISDASNKNKTKSVTVGQLSEYFNSNAVTSELYEKTIVLTLTELSALNGGNTRTYFDIPEIGSNTAVSVIQLVGYLQAGSTPFNLSGGGYLTLGIGTNVNVVDYHLQYFGTDFINQTVSGYAIATNSFSVGTFLTLPLGSELGISLWKSGGAPTITEGNGTLTLKVLYTLTDFS